MKSKERLAKRQEKLDTLIWWYEDLRYVNVDHIIRERLELGEGNSLTMGYGKLMDRWLKFRELNGTYFRLVLKIFSLEINILFRDKIFILEKKYFI